MNPELALKKICKSLSFRPVKLVPEETREERKSFSVIGDFSEQNPKSGSRGSDLDRRSRLEKISRYLNREVSRTHDLLTDPTPFQLVEELVQQSAPTNEEIQELGFELPMICNRLDQFLEGSLERSDLSRWVCEALKFAITLSLRDRSCDGDMVENSLGLLALVTDDDFASPDTSLRLCKLIEDRISLSLPIPTRRAISELLRELGNASMTICDRGPDPENPVWMDIALLPRNQSYPSTNQPQDTWFQPLSVSTRQVWKEISPSAHWTHVENNLVPALVEQEPWLTNEFDGLSLYLDPDGITEAVIETTQIGSREVRKAVSGFRALHQMKRCFIDGIPVHSRKEDL